MSGEDRFGLQGAPEIREARHVKFGTGSVFIFLLVGLVIYGIATVLEAQNWPGQLGGGLGVLMALLGIGSWWNRRKGQEESASNRYFAWYGTGYLLMKAWSHVDGQPVHGAELVIPLALTIAAPLLIWSMLRQEDK